MISIAIDGPAGAGKSSVAKEVAFKLGYLYVDTGALYRAIGLHMLEQDIDINNEILVTAELPNLNINLKFSDGRQIILLNQEDISLKIRSENVSMAASKISAFGCVRSYLLGLQRTVAANNNVVMDGRDIGTVILPNAAIKIFLFASAEERAKRRFLELKDKGANYEKILQGIKIRDDNDSNREIAPLKPANDAILLDSTNLNFQQVVERILEISALKTIAGGERVD